MATSGSVRATSGQSLDPECDLPHKSVRKIAVAHFFPRISTRYCFVAAFFDHRPASAATTRRESERVSMATATVHRTKRVLKHLICNVFRPQFTGANRTSRTFISNTGVSRGFCALHHGRSAARRKGGAIRRINPEAAIGLAAVTRRCQLGRQETSARMSAGGGRPRSGPGRRGDEQQLEACTPLRASDRGR